MRGFCIAGSRDLRPELEKGNTSSFGIVALMVGWSLLTDFDAIKRAGVPILRSLNIRFRLKQQALLLLG